MFVNAKAKFNCSVTSSAIYTSWTVNGDLINSNQTLRDAVDIDTSTVDGTLLHILVVPASVVKNNSVIVCVVFANGEDESDTSDGAVLTKQGTCSLDTILVIGMLACNMVTLLYRDYCRSAGSSG